jgi:hypothetical protein
MVFIEEKLFEKWRAKSASKLIIYVRHLSSFLRDFFTSVFPKGMPSALVVQKMDEVKRFWNKISQ